MPYDACKQSFVGMGFPEWQADGVIELMKAVNDGAAWTKLPHTDTEKLLGRAPTLRRCRRLHAFQVNFVLAFKSEIQFRPLKKI